MISSSREQQNSGQKGKPGVNLMQFFIASIGGKSIFGKRLIIAFRFYRAVVWRGAGGITARGSCIK
jgi:hypothetical protein